MRILVVQLARFGDIYQTWPALSALRRERPDAEIHILVRARFRAATEGLREIVVHEMPTADLIAPVIAGVAESEITAPLEAFVSSLGSFDQIYNLSFSPVSSYLVDMIAGPSTRVNGYSRHSDGFLSIPDDASAYFYAQVGIGRNNRYHLTDVFAAVCEVSLTPTDFDGGRAAQRAKRILVHIGASQIEKAYPAELWSETLKSLNAIYDGEIVLIGSQEEQALAAVIAESTGVINRVGESRLQELFQWIGEAELLIGADSAPIHIATLTATPVLNLSSSTVNFWETGPIAAGSRVLHETAIGDIAPGRVAAEALAMVEKRPPQGPCFVRAEASFEPVLKQTDDFNWHLIQALYTGTEYPKTEIQADQIAFQRLFELAELAVTQLARWDDPSTQSTRAQILSKVDEMLEEIPRLNAHVVPVVQWFQTQRLRTPPGTPEETLQASRKQFEDLLWVAAVYRPQRAVADEAARAAELCARLAPALREFEFQEVESDFHSMVATFHELARHSTKVGDRDWSTVLESLNEALHRRDLIELADQLEFELKVQMETLRLS